MPITSNISTSGRFPHWGDFLRFRSESEDSYGGRKRNRKHVYEEK